MSAATTTTYSPSQLQALPEIHNLMFALANSQDALDLELFGSLWRQDKPCRFDASKHLPEHQPKDVTASEMVQSLVVALSGFDGTQHALSNMTVRFDGAKDGQHVATVRNNITAYHYLSLNDGEPTFVTMRGTWETRLERQGPEKGVPASLQAIHGPMGDWTVAGIKVSRDMPLEGRAELYDIAKRRALDGLGRLPASSARS